MVAMCPNLWSLWGGHCTEKHICISKTLHEMRVEGEISEERGRERERELMDDSGKKCAEIFKNEDSGA